MVRFLVSMLLVATTTIAAAENPEGARLFEEGRALAKEGKYAEACARFEESLALDRAIGTRLNYADCHEKLGHLAQAHELFEEVAETEKTNDPDRAQYARERATALVGKLGTVVVKLASPDQPGISVTVAGKPAQPAAEIRVLVDPGEVAVSVSAPGGEPFNKVARADAGATVVIEVPAPGASTSVEPGPTSSARRSRVIVAGVIGGIGVVGLATGVLLGVKANSDYDAQISNGNCTNGSPPMCNAEGFTAQSDAVTLANIGTVFGIGGLALMTAGAIVYFTAPKDVVVAPTATAQSAGVAVVGRF
jgi:hypothetical protein